MSVGAYRVKIGTQRPGCTLFARSSGVLGRYSRGIHHAPELLRRLKRRDELARHVDGLVGLRVARYAGRALPNPERAEPAEFDGVSGFERFHHRNHEPVHDGLGLQLGQAGPFGDAVYDIGFSHNREVSWQEAEGYREAKAKHSPALAPALHVLL